MFPSFQPHWINYIPISPRDWFPPQFAHSSSFSPSLDFDRSKSLTKITEKWEYSHSSARNPAVTGPLSSITATSRLQPTPPSTFSVSSSKPLSQPTLPALFSLLSPMSPLPLPFSRFLNLAFFNKYFNYCLFSPRRKHCYTRRKDGFFYFNFSFIIVISELFIFWEHDRENQ